MRVLVTGLTGFVGGWLGVELARSNPDAEVWGTTHGPDGPPLPAGFPAGARFLPCDLTDPQQVCHAVEESRPDQVFHLAGFASAAGGDGPLVHRVNVDATVHLLEALATQDKPCRVLLASSGYVYGPTTPGRPACEDDPLAPRGVYGESKAAMERAVEPFTGRGGLSLTIVRAFNHTGPRQATGFVVPDFARQIIRAEQGLEPPTIRVGNLDARRDFLDVRDVVRAYRLLLAMEPAPHRVVNVASGTPRSVEIVLNALLSQARATLRVERDASRMRPSDMPECVGDPSLLRTLTGWRPQVEWNQTLSDCLAWWRDQTAASA